MAVLPKKKVVTFKQQRSSKNENRRNQNERDS
jgi:hypothetical protein